MDDQRIKAWARLHLEDAGAGPGVEGVGGQAVDGLGGSADRRSRLQEPHGFGQAGGVRRADQGRCSKNQRPVKIWGSSSLPRACWACSQAQTPWMGTTCTVMFSSSSPPPGPTLRRPLARYRAILELLEPAEFGPSIRKSSRAARKPVSSSSSRTAALSKLSCAWPDKSPTRPAGSSITAQEQGTRYCSTRTISPESVTGTMPRS